MARYVLIAPNNVTRRLKGNDRLQASGASENKGVKIVKLKDKIA